MAVTLTADALRDHLGIKDTPAGNVTASRLFNVARALVERYAPSCPDDVHDENLSQNRLNNISRDASCTKPRKLFG